MSAQVFASFGQAAAFARRMAQDQRISVRIARRGDEFVVEEPAQPSEGAGSTPIAGPLPPPGASGPGSAVAALAGDRRCIECGAVISPARVLALPEVARCVICQSSYEATHDTRRRVDEGFAGTREDHKTMRGQLRGDIRHRDREG